MNPGVSGFLFLPNSFQKTRAKLAWSQAQGWAHPAKDIPVAMASPDLFFLSVTSQVPAQG